MLVRSFDKIVWEPGQEQPDIRPVDVRLYRLHKKVEYHWIGNFDHHTEYFTIRIPEGFLCDGAGPRFGWSITGIRPDGLVRMPSLVHDALNRSGGGSCNHDLEIMIYSTSDAEGSGFAGMRTLSNKACDQVFRACWIAVSPREVHRAKFAYVMLRLFGRWAYGRRTPPYAKRT